MEYLLKVELCLQTLNTLGAPASGGCISKGQSYNTDKGAIFVKSNPKPEVCIFFQWIKVVFLVLINRQKLCSREKWLALMLY